MRIARSEEHSRGRRTIATKVPPASSVSSRDKARIIEASSARGPKDIFIVPQIDADILRLCGMQMNRFQSLGDMLQSKWCGGIPARLVLPQDRGLSMGLCDVWLSECCRLMEEYALPHLGIW